MTPKLSIIIPTLNEEKIIGQTIERLQAGLSISHELIVSDDISDDKSVEVAKKYADKVVVMSGQSKVNAGEVRNRGAKVASGEFLVFIDCGCFVIEPETFFKQALENFDNKKIIGLSGNVEVQPEIRTVLDRVISAIINTGYRLLNNVFHYGSAWGKFIMVRKESFEAIHGFREDIAAGEDINFFYRLSKIGKTHFDNRLIIFHPNRRAHQIGWIRLLFIWTRNTLYLIFFGKSYSKEWKPIR